jgi:hypothetical protein
MPRPARPRRGRSRGRLPIPSLSTGARSSRMQRASRKHRERRPASAIPTIHGSGAPTRTQMAFSGTGSRRAGASTMSATARCRGHAIHSTGDHASVSSGSAPGRSTTASRCTCSEDSPPKESLCPSMYGSIVIWIALASEAHKASLLIKTYGLQQEDINCACIMIFRHIPAPPHLSATSAYLCSTSAQRMCRLGGRHINFQQDLNRISLRL